MNPHIETLAIGDELLNGTISDTNTRRIGKILFGHRLRLSGTRVIPDNPEQIKESIRDCSERCDFVCGFGGLGPTSDDRTAEVVAELIGGKLETHLPSKERLVARYQSLGKEVTDQALKQVRYPEKASPMRNGVGFAPGFAFKRGKCHFFFMPGVPREMNGMFLNEVLPEILQVSHQLPESEKIESQIWKCIGITEPNLQSHMNEVEKNLDPHAWLGYRTHYPENHVILYYRIKQASDNKKFQTLRGEISSVLSPWCFSENDLDLEELVIESLKEKNLKIVLVESCTGGLVAHRLVSVAGASDVVWGGIVSYQFEAKNSILGLSLKNSEQAVSQQCGRDLAENALRLSKCPIAAAVTGYVGPSGGTEQDPVGTIYICVAGRDTARLEKRLTLHTTDRKLAQKGASSYVLSSILEYLRS